MTNFGQNFRFLVQGGQISREHANDNSLFHSNNWLKKSLEHTH